MIRAILRNGFGVGILMVTAGCVSAKTEPPYLPTIISQTDFPPATNVLLEQAIPAPTLIPSPVLLPENNIPREEQAPRFTPLPVAPDPLAITFPTPGANSVSLWRPPLYPTPWEPTPQDHFYFTRPIGANDVNWPLARYRYGYLLYSSPHTGIDIPAPKRTPILAAGSGTVIHAGYGLYFMREEFRDPYGIAVAIKHDFGYQGKLLYTVYGHMDETIVYPGQKVEAGEVIGLVGETGHSSGPHLHLEIRIGDQTFFSSRNPELWISPPQGWGLLVGRITENGGRKIPEVKIKLINLVTDRVYETITYAPGSVNPDEYYNENFVLGDIPAGFYRFSFESEGVARRTLVEIQPGEVTFLGYTPKDGFDFRRPADKTQRFIKP